jgi:hypothetical protein
MLREKIAGKQAGIVTYGLTPPKANLASDRIAEIAQKQFDRLRDLEIDGLILYDIQDEPERTDLTRPFPFLQTVDPTAYSSDYLADLPIPKIIYRSVGKYTNAQLTEWIRNRQSARDQFTVFVGASSSNQEVKLKLTEAYELSRKHNDRLVFGGVVIPERHMKYEDEHLRIAGKINHGCQFFVSQATYNIEATKNFLSDYYYYCKANEVKMAPILINLAPCGSLKTIEFMKWLGISIPKWLENDLLNSNDILDKSMSASRAIFEELLDFAMDKGIPLGCSVESVSTRKVEIDASIQLLKEIQAIFRKRMM